MSASRNTRSHGENRQGTAPNVELLKQVKGVGPQIALTYVLTLDDPQPVRRVARSAVLWGVPGRRDSGESKPQMKISKGRKTVIERPCGCRGRIHLGTFGGDRDLRRWGLKLAARGGKRLRSGNCGLRWRESAVLLHHLWVSGGGVEPPAQ